MDGTVIARIAVWFDQRLGAAQVTETGARKVFPEHWSFLLGELALYSFIVLLATGTFLAMFFESSLDEMVYQGPYEPLQGLEVSAAFDSVMHLSFEVRAGLLIRQIHHWAALIFMAAIVVHLLRIFFTGAYRRPREVNWVLGVTLMVLGILEGFAGYSLPDDLLSGTGLRIGFSIAQSIPVVGASLAFLVWGGEYPGDQIISRLFIAHVWIIPLVMLGLITAHLGLVVRQKHTQFAGPNRTNDNVVGQRLWPTYATKAIGLLFLLAGVLTLLATLFQINPIWIYGPYDPAAVSTGAQPDWYMGWLEGALRLMPPWQVVAFGREIPNVFFPGVLVAGLTFGGLYAWPFVDQWLTAEADREHHLLDRPRDRPARTAFGVGVLAFYTVLFLGGSNDILAVMTNWRVERIVVAFRVLLLVVPPVAAVATLRVCRQLRAADDHRRDVDAVREMTSTNP